jgi:hypothetical protein
MFPGSCHLHNSVVYFYRNRCATVEWGLDGRLVDDVIMLVHCTDNLRLDQLGAQLASSEYRSCICSICDVTGTVHIVDGCQWHSRCLGRVLNFFFFTDATRLPYMRCLRHNLLHSRLHKQIDQISTLATAKWISITHGEHRDDRKPLVLSKIHPDIRRFEQATKSLDTR